MKIASVHCNIGVFFDAVKSLSEEHGVKLEVSQNGVLATRKNKRHGGMDTILIPWGNIMWLMYAAEPKR